MGYSARKSLPDVAISYMVESPREGLLGKDKSKKKKLPFEELSFQRRRAALVGSINSGWPGGAAVLCGHSSSPISL